MEYFLLQLTNALIDFVVDSNLSFHTIHQPSLQSLLETLSRRKVEMPSTKYFMECLKNRYEGVRIKIKNMLDAQTNICLTADVWSSRAQAYLGITVHFITETFERKSFLLAFRQLKGRQTHDVLAAEICKILRDFGIANEKITNIVTDGCSAFCKAFKRFGTQHDPFVEDVVEDNGENEEDETSKVDRYCNEVPFIQNEDGELLVSNVISLNHETVSEVNLENNRSLDTSPIENLDSIDEYLLNEVAGVQIDSIVLPPQRRCLSHMLNLVSADFQKNLNPQANSVLLSALNKVQALGNFVHRSARGKQMCLEIVGCTIPLACVTRWNSRFDTVVKVCSTNVKPKVNAHHIYKLLVMQIGRC